MMKKTSTTRTAIVQLLSESSDIDPIIEMQWDINRPDEVGLRLADVPDNTGISKWRLTMLGGDRALVAAVEGWRWNLDVSR